MTVTIRSDTIPRFPDVPVQVTVEDAPTGYTVASMALTHSELADLYLALTDYYADNKEN